MTISIEFDGFVPDLQSDKTISQFIACVAYHSGLLNGSIVEPKESPYEPIERLLSEYRWLLNITKAPYIVGAGGSHIWVAHTTGNRIFKVLFRD